LYFRRMLPENEITLCLADMSILLRNVRFASYNIRARIHAR